VTKALIRFVVWSGCRIGSLVAETVGRHFVVALTPTSLSKMADDSIGTWSYPARLQSTMADTRAWVRAIFDGTYAANGPILSD
jgi:hypothetical protein